MLASGTSGTLDGRRAALANTFHCVASGEASTSREAIVAAGQAFAPIDPAPFGC